MFLALLIVASPNGAVLVGALVHIGAAQLERALFSDAQGLPIDVTRVGPPVRSSKVLERPAAVCLRIIEILVAQETGLKIRMMWVVRKEKMSNDDTFPISPTAWGERLQNATERRRRMHAP